MNIFALATEPTMAAAYMCDRHVVKMITESGQMMAIVCRNMGVTDMPLTKAGNPWRGSHANHPCTKWVGETWGNFLWLFTHAQQLNYEFRRRYNHNGRQVDHASWIAIKHMFCEVQGLWYGATNLGKETFKGMDMTTDKTPFARAFGDFVVHDDVPTVQAYRDYYKQKVFADGRTMKWTNRNQPHWYNLPPYSRNEVDSLAYSVGADTVGIGEGWFE